MNSFSPVAIGTGLRALTSASAATEPTLTGSSMNSGRSGATAWAKAMANSGTGLPWVSSRISSSGPAASRIACAHATEWSTAAGSSGVVRVSSGLPLIPAKPFCCAATAVAAASSGLAKLPPFEYTRTRSRRRPPSTVLTGTPHALPARS